MALEDDIRRLKEINEEIARISRQLNETPKVFKPEDIKEAERYLRGLKSELRDLQDSAGELSGAFRAVVQEITKQSKGLVDSRKAFRSLTSLADKFRDDQLGITKLNSKQLSQLQSKINSEKENLRSAEGLLQTELKSLDAELLRKKQQAERVIESNKDESIKNKALKNFLKQEKELNAKIQERENALNSITSELYNQNSLSKELLDKVEERRKEEERISEIMGLGGASLKGVKNALDKIGLGGLAEKLGLEDAEKAMRKVAEELINGDRVAGKFGGKFDVLAAGIKSMGGSLIKNLKDPLSFIVFMVNQLKQAFITSDKLTGDLAKNMNMTYYEALAVRGELMAFASASNDTFLTTQKLQESLQSINQSLGTSVMFLDQDLALFTKLREQAGLTNDQIMGTYKLSLLNGKSLEDNTSEFLAQAKITGYNNKVLLNDKELLKDISKTSAATQLSLSGSAKALGEALATAKSLGMTMDQIESSSEALLNFESSITNELKAELLLGRDINLERARLAALNNEFAIVAEEISNQIGNSADFSKMNRIQQEAIAQSVGMTRNSLAQTLIEREALVGLSEKEQELGQRTLDNLISQYGIEGAQRKLEKDGIKNLMDQTSVQEEFTASVEKLKEIFVAMSPAIIGIMELLTGVLSIAELIVKPFTALAGLLNKVHPILSGIITLLSAAAIAALVFKGILSPLSVLTSLAVIGGSIALVQGMLPDSTLGDDMISGTPGYGKRALYDEGELTLLNDRDTVIAGTDLFKPALANDMIAGNPQIIENTTIESTTPQIIKNTTIQPVNQSQNTSMEVSQLKSENEAIKQETKKTNNLLESLITATKANKTVEMEDTFAPLYGS